MVSDKRFSPAFLKDFLISSFEKGMIVYKYVSEIDCPKHKFFIVTGLDTDTHEAKIVFINSNLSPYAEKRPEIRNCNIRIEPENYDFLSHSSYINCSSVITICFHKLFEELLSDFSKIKGRLSEFHLKEVSNQINRSITVSRKDKKIIQKDWTKENIEALLNSGSPSI